MTAVPPGWILEESANGDARYVLGEVGSNPLVVFGLNPSTARPNDLNPTLKRVVRFAADNGFDGWTMLNIYPQWSTDPHELHDQHDPGFKAENERHIAAAIQGRAPLLAAWGTGVTLRPYLRVLLSDIFEITTAESAQWVHVGELTQGRHPRHPLYVRADAPFNAFDVESYRTQTLRRR